MKIKTNIYAGMTLDECNAQRDWWKNQAQMMEAYYNNSKALYPPAGLWFPCQGNPPSGGGTTSPPPPPPNASGGWVAGVWVPDMSGSC